MYVLADLTNSLVDCCKMHQLRGTADGMGYFGYHRDESYNAYIQVISFDGLVQAAKERNRAFFDTLGFAGKLRPLSGNSDAEGMGAMAVRLTVQIGYSPDTRRFWTGVVYAAFPSPSAP